jgi:hypothetical protein
MRLRVARPAPDYHLPDGRAARPAVSRPRTRASFRGAKPDVTVSVPGTETDILAHFRAWFLQF